MSRDIPFNKDDKCDGCGKSGAFDMMGDCYCPDCLVKMYKIDDTAAIFERCIDRKILDDGALQINCKLGLWGVTSKNHTYAEKEAFHYWIQYYQDGEYVVVLDKKAGDSCVKS